MNNDPEIKVSVISSPPLWRMQTIRVLQTLGVILGLLGLADTQKMIEALSPEVAAWLALSGAALRFGVEPLILLLGDFVDDGKFNKSFQLDKLPVVFLLLVISFTCVLISSCAGLSVRSNYGSFDSTASGVLYTPAPRPVFIPIHTTK